MEERYRCPAEEAFAYAIERTGVLKEAEALGYALKYQYPVHRYKVDFAFLHGDGRRLVVEIDGTSHNGEGQQARDRERDNFLQLLGFRVLRFDDDHLVRPIDSKNDRARDCAEQTLLHLQTMPVLQPVQLNVFDKAYCQYLKKVHGDHPRNWRGVAVLDKHGQQEYTDAYRIFIAHEGKLTEFLNKETAGIALKGIVSYLNDLTADDPLLTRQQISERYHADFARLLKERKHNIKEFEKERKKREAKAQAKAANKPWTRSI